MSRRILLRRTLGIEIPEDLAFGEPVFVEGRAVLIVGKSNGSFIEFGSSTPSDLADVAYSGSYDDLTDKPTIPVLPPLADVAYSGDYNDLANLPAPGGASTELIPAAGVEVATNKLFHNGTGYKPVYRQRLTVATPYPANNYIVRSHGIGSIEHIVDYALYYRGSGYLYKVVYNEIPSGITETALFGLTDWIWGSAKNKNTDGSASQGAWWQIEYTKTTDSYVTV